MSIKLEYIKSLVATNERYPHLNAMILAQAIHETADFTSLLATNHKNTHGMKWRTPPMEKYAAPITVKVPSETKPVTFCHFNTWENAVKGYFLFLSRAPYAGWEGHVDSGESFIKFIGPIWCPPSADPKYIEKVMRHLPKAKADLLAFEGQPPNPGPGPVTLNFPILLDPGHHAKKAGSRSRNGRVREEYLNLAQAIHVQKRLKEVGIQGDVYDPPEDNLGEIGRRARGYKMFVSFHHNSADGITYDVGAEVLYDNDKSEAASRAFAADLAKRISLALGIQNRGAKAQGLGVLDAAEQVFNGPAVLVESYFVTTHTDEADCLARSLKAADAIFEGIVAYARANS